MGVGSVELESGEEGFSQGAKSIGGSRPVGKIIKMKVVFVGQVNIGTTDGELTGSFRGTTAGAAVIVPEAPLQHATADTTSTTNMLGHPNEEARTERCSGFVHDITVKQCKGILTKTSLLSKVELYLVMIDRNEDEMDKGWS